MLSAVAAQAQTVIRPNGGVAVGLDLLEFTVAIEDAFGIFIPDADGQRLLTPGDLIDYLETRLQPGESVECLEQRAFYLLRKAGMQVLEQPREAFRPTTPWTELLHPEDRARQWTLIGRATTLSPWPRLKPPLSFGTPTQTLGDTAKYLTATAPHSLMTETEGWSRPRIEAIVRRLMDEELGVTAFQWSDQFVRDLGCS
jgi:hypothetical protein